MVEGEEHLKPGDWRYTPLEKALNGSLMGSKAYVPACVHDHKDFISELSGLLDAGGDAEIRP